jgi:hypothetical protein
MKCEIHYSFSLYSMHYFKFSVELTPLLSTQYISQNCLMGVVNSLMWTSLNFMKNIPIKNILLRLSFVLEFDTNVLSLPFHFGPEQSNNKPTVIFIVLISENL